LSIWLYLAYTLLNLILLIWGITLSFKTKRLSVVILAVVIFGLMYDNLILSLGNVVSNHQLLYGFSLPRFLMHQLILPWIILAAFDEIRMLGHGWAQIGRARVGAVILSVIVMVLGILTRLIPMHLQLTIMDGVTRFVDVAAKGPPIVSIVSIGFVTILGITIWRRNHFPWLFLAGLLVFIGEGIPVEWVRRTIGSGAEVLFMAAMLYLEQVVIGRNKK
jgi:hypothetical protein